jgi:hypothetical protein
MSGEEQELSGAATMPTIIRIESRRRFEKHGLANIRQALQRGINNPAEQAEAKNWVVEEASRQQHQAQRHYWWLLAFVMVAVLGACVIVWQFLTH